MFVGSFDESRALFAKDFISRRISIRRVIDKTIYGVFSDFTVRIKDNRIGGDDRRCLDYRFDDVLSRVPHFFPASPLPRM